MVVNILDRLEWHEHDEGVICALSRATSGLECGTFTSSDKWFMLQWPRLWISFHITVKELLPIVLYSGSSVKHRVEGRLPCNTATIVPMIKSG